jgi:hypothetical protein
MAKKLDISTPSAQQPVRVIVRFSLDGDTGSLVRNAIRPFLESFINTRTGTWESNAMPMHEATRALRRLLSALRDAHATNRGAIVDHVWIYLDQALVTPDEDEDDDDES